MGLRFRNLAYGSGNFNKNLIKGTTGNPFTTENPVIDASGIHHRRAGGYSLVYLNSRQETNALTGDAQVLRLRAEDNVAGRTSQLRALLAQVAQLQNAGTNSVACGIVVECMAKGKSVTTLRGVEIIADNTEGTGTITDIVGARVRVVGAAATLSGKVWGVEIEDDSATASANPQALHGFIRLTRTSTTTQACAIDATNANLRGAAQYGVTLTTDDNVLFYYKDKDGTAHAVVASDADTLAIRT
jgi:hypothetical protein